MANLRTFAPTNESTDCWSAAHSYDFNFRAKWMQQIKSILIFWMSSINPNRAGLKHVASVQWGLNQPIPSRSRVDICEKMHYYNLEKQNLIVPLALLPLMKHISPSKIFVCKISKCLIPLLSLVQPVQPTIILYSLFMRSTHFSRKS